MKDLTLEQELQARIFVHKSAILGAFVSQEYMTRKRNENGVDLPEFILHEQATEFSNHFMQQALKDGMFNDMYEVAWDKLSDIIPDNLSIF